MAVLGQLLVIAFRERTLPDVQTDNQLRISCSLAYTGRCRSSGRLVARWPQAVFCDVTCLIKIRLNPDQVAVLRSLRQCVEPRLLGHESFGTNVESGWFITTPPMRKTRQTPPRYPEKEAHRPSLCRSRRPRPHTHSRPPETSQNLPSRSPHPRSPLHRCTVKFRPLQVPRKMRSDQRFTYLALDQKRNPRPERRLLPAHPPRPIQSHPLDSETFIQTDLELLAGDRYLQKGMGLMALTRRRPAEIFFSASFSHTSLSSPHLRRPTGKPGKFPVPVP